ncbi:hypothetical protein BJ138DRAFT_1016865 [Hygrophoropsis aurantiaca]|uniref:Uncharacterized protein n=1 Tax=Hygrophoropsis aurantiaca TaxID=72124 RepID=A0ACB7ZY77_9AGAM|nr:hypothetical protein BJ138DRAFT_1016865 [Hygrophoropsis aurantiaca]
MVAGQRTGKTSLLRLLLDTCSIAATASKDQLASVAKFVQGCSGHTAHIRTAAVDIDHPADPAHVLTLSLVDTPSLDWADDRDPAADRLVQDILHHIEARFAEPIGDHHVHLCIYFLDPDRIVPPGPPAPLAPRARTNSFSHTDPDPLILEPPVTTIPGLCRPTLPLAEINTIRRLSARVNVLPVIARADTLTNDRLAAVKTAVRRDLADAGIGFGIFDMDYQSHPDSPDRPNGYASPPPSPDSAARRLPYALVSPDCYSHSDGVVRVPLSRHELVHRYTPSPHSPPKLVQGWFTRNYRWGSMDVLDPAHSDFLPLRAAIFHHMPTLQKYTREYLFEKFRSDYLAQHHLPNQQQHSLLHPQAQGLVPRTQLLSLSRPVLSIETAPSNRHPSLSAPPADLRAIAVTRPPLDPPAKSSSSGRSSKQRTKKITVACNFCRSRKLKCDGGRPACSQCVKRSNPCDYMPQTSKRRNSARRKDNGNGNDNDNDGDSDSDASPDDPDADQDDNPSLSPEIPPQQLSSRRPPAVVPVPAPIPQLDGYAGSEPLPPVGRAKGNSVSSAHGRPLFKDNELPHIATLLPDGSPSASASASTAMMTAPPLPPIRPASEQQAAQRKRASTVPGRSNRQAASAGPKVVACNFCRARKTKCDGAHPACSSCARRSLPCNYNHETANGGHKKGSRRASTSKAAPSPPSSSTAGVNGELAQGEPMDVDLKRKMDGVDSAMAAGAKRMRVDDAGAIP